MYYSKRSQQATDNIEHVALTEHNATQYNSYTRSQAAGKLVN